MHYKDNFEDALSRVAYAHSVVENAGYPVSDRDRALSWRLKELLKDAEVSKAWYDINGNLKEYVCQT